jgi:hypothetical protein
MNCCARWPRRAALVVGAALLAGSALAQAQAIRNFPRFALRGEIEFGQPPQVVLNGQATRLSPGSRIRGQNNMLVMTGALAGQKWVVNYTLDMTGQLHDLWILRDEEAAVKPWPKTLEEARSWTFDGQTWTKP